VEKKIRELKLLEHHVFTKLVDNESSELVYYVEGDNSDTVFKPLLFLFWIHLMKNEVRYEGGVGDAQPTGYVVGDDA
jgi:hypothetical protein